MYKILSLLVLAFFINSCDSTRSKNKYNISEFENDSCSIVNQNRFVYNFMQDNYLWYKDIPNLDYTKYESPYALFKDLKVPQDKWSFIVDKQILDDYFSGKGYVGFGFKFTQMDDGYYLQMVFKDSPAANASLQRGDKILKINGNDISNLDINSVISLLGPREVGISRTFTIKKRDGTIEDVSLTKAKVDVKSVLAKKIIESSNHKIGYLLFDKFIETSSKELSEAFNYFKNEGIDSLIIDMRYNGGGLVSVAQELSSLIREENSGDLLFKLQFNDKNRDRDKSYYFKAQNSSLNGIERVYFLTTDATCSASEAVINGLKPYIDVKIIGTTTCGKPVGMVGGEFCQKYIVPIEFEILNSQGEGRYFNGLSPTCQVEDDLSHNLGSENEAMLKEALLEIGGAKCVSSSKSAKLIKTKSKNLNMLNSLINSY